MGRLRALCSSASFSSLEDVILWLSNSKSLLVYYGSLCALLVGKGQGEMPRELELQKLEKAKYMFSQCHLAFLFQSGCTLFTVDGDQHLSVFPSDRLSAAYCSSWFLPISGSGSRSYHILDAI